MRVSSCLSKRVHLVFLRMVCMCWRMAVGVGDHVSVCTKFSHVHVCFPVLRENVLLHKVWLRLWLPVLLPFSMSGKDFFCGGAFMVILQNFQSHIQTYITVLYEHISCSFWKNKYQSYMLENIIECNFVQLVAVRLVILCSWSQYTFRFGFIASMEQ